jgi:hypothetical protein
LATLHTSSDPKGKEKSKDSGPEILVVMRKSHTFPILFMVTSTPSGYIRKQNRTYGMSQQRLMVMWQEMELATSPFYLVARH